MLRVPVQQWPEAGGAGLLGVANVSAGVLRRRCQHEAWVFEIESLGNMDVLYRWSRMFVEKLPPSCSRAQAPRPRPPLLDLASVHTSARFAGGRACLLRQSVALDLCLGTRRSNRTRIDDGRKGLETTLVPVCCNAELGAGFCNGIPVAAGPVKVLRGDPGGLFHGSQALQTGAQLIDCCHQIHHAGGTRDGPFAHEIAGVKRAALRRDIWFWRAVTALETIAFRHMQVSGGRFPGLALHSIFNPRLPYSCSLLALAWAQKRMLHMHLPSIFALDKNHNPGLVLPSLALAVER